MTTQVRAQPFDPIAEQRRYAVEAPHGRCGATVSFVGTMRDFNEAATVEAMTRPRNTVMLPGLWYLTALSIPALVYELSNGQTLVDFVNPRPDSIDVLMKAKTIVIEIPR